MEMLLRCLVLFEISCLASSLNVYEPARGPAWNYFGYSWMGTPPSVVFRKPMSAMVDLTNDLGVAILQDYAYSRSNFAFSPYGVASVLVVLYEGARSESARQIHRAVKFPWDRDITRIGFRDIHRHLRTYFSHEGYLSGITLSKEGSTLKPEYKRILRFYGYDIDVDHQEKGGDLPAATSTEKIAPTSGFTVPAAGVSSVSTVTEGSETAPASEAASTEGTKTEPTSSEVEAVSGHEQFAAGATEVNGENPWTDIAEDPSESTLNSDAETTSTEDPTSTSAYREEEGEIQNSTTEEASGKTESDLRPTPTKSDSLATEAASGSDSYPSTTEMDPIPAEEGGTTAATDSVALLAEEATTLVPLGDSKEFSSLEEPRALDDLPADGHEQGGVKYELDNGMLIPPAESHHNFSYYDTKSENTSNANDSIENAEKTVERYDSTASQIREDSEGVLAAEDSSDLTPETLFEFLSKLKTAADSGGGSIRNRRLVSAWGTTRTNSRSRYPRISAFERFGNGSDAFAANEANGSERAAVRADANPQPETRPMDFQTFAALNSGMRECSRSGKEKRTLSDFLKVPVVPDLSLQLQNGMFDSHVSKDYSLYRALPRFLFLVDGAIDTPVPMMTYTNIFPFAYIPRLHCKALEFPLDDERYKLLIILPVERRGLRQLIYDLTAYSLRNVIDVLRPARVKAMVPTFMVEGFVILTPTLQKLGIWDVFDPRKSDLSGMTTDPDLYVRNIEQSVTVVIRNYVEILDIQTRTMAARDVNDDFIASHPFLYFVMDTTTNVALMAGLNVGFV